MAFLQLSPIQRDAVVIVGSLALFLSGVALAVTYGVTFDPAGGGLAPWAIGVIAAVFLAFACSVVWYYYVYGDEREPARGEFTMDAEHRVRGGAGSYRAKALGAGAAAEPEARLASEPGFVPRTWTRWFAWVGAIGLALLAAGGLVLLSRGAEDPMPPLLAATALIGAAIMFGAVGVGEMAHEGPWARQARR